jgi:hypothetical protein
VTDAYDYNQWELKLLERPSIDAYRTIVHELGAAMRTQGKPCFVVTLPNWPGKDHFAARYAPVASIFQTAAIPFHDLLDDFVRAYPSGGEVLQWGINPVNGHPSAVGTRFYARETADILEKEYASLLGYRTQRPVGLAAGINDWMPPAANVRPLKAGQWEFTYPGAAEEMLEMPLGKNHVMLAFEEPVTIDRLRLSGETLLDAEVSLSTVDPATGIERKEPFLLGQKAGRELSWENTSLPHGTLVSSVRIAADLSPQASDVSDGELRLTVYPADPGNRP